MGQLFFDYLFIKILAIIKSEMIERNYEIIMNYKDLILKDIKKGILLVGSCILLIICCVITMISYSNHRLLDASN